ncbi:MAG: hypothetical protein JNM99_20430 [Verrucomicrobiaceae bacterium]|nr:hypothetical protein [Verrucomicrobiaceae bacterium]
MNFIRSRCVALLLLCLYGMAATPVTSLAFMGMALVSEEHEVQIVMDGRGSLEVVLHHHHTYTPCVRDHSGTVDRILASLCKGDDAGDHVFNMSPSAPTMEPKASRADAAARTGNERSAPWSSLSAEGFFPLHRVTNWTMPRAIIDMRASNDAARPYMGTLVLLV